MTLNKRQILLALVALGAGAGVAAAQSTTLDLVAGRAIGEAYLAAHPEDADVVNSARGRSDFVLDDAQLSRFRAMASEDFTAGRTFTYQGWFLSRTEGRLFALLTVV